MKPSPGSHVMDCYDQAAALVRKLGCVVTFEFNEVHCGIRPWDVVSSEAKESRELFERNYQIELVKKTGSKICYPNP
jgi:hypothetical protein